MKVLLNEVAIILLYFFTCRFWIVSLNVLFCFVCLFVGLFDLFFVCSFGVFVCFLFFLLFNDSVKISILETTYNID